MWVEVKCVVLEMLLIVWMIEMLDSCGDFVFVDFECVIVVFDVFVICIGMWFDVVCLNLYLFVVCFGNRDELVCIVSLDLVML